MLEAATPEGYATGSRVLDHAAWLQEGLGCGGFRSHVSPATSAAWPSSAHPPLSPRQPAWLSHGHTLPRCPQW